VKILKGTLVIAEVDDCGRKLNTFSCDGFLPTGRDVIITGRENYITLVGLVGKLELALGIAEEALNTTSKCDSTRGLCHCKICTGVSIEALEQIKETKGSDE